MGTGSSAVVGLKYDNNAGLTPCNFFFFKFWLKIQTNTGLTPLFTYVLKMDKFLSLIVYFIGLLMGFEAFFFLQIWAEN